MTSDSPQPAAAPPETEVDLGRGIVLVGLMAGGVACGAILLMGISQGVTTGQAIIYSLAALLYLGLVLAPAVSWPGARWIRRHLWAYLLLIGAVCVALQALSGEDFLQPIIFTIPLVQAALAYPLWRAAAVGALYLGLMNLGIALGGADHAADFLYPTVGYTTLMILIVASARLSVEQSRARRRADELAADLARQRDYLARLSQITATLTRDLDLATVLAQVAAEGRALAHAAQARVWLLETPDDGHDTPVQLAAAVPRLAAGTSWPGPALDRLQVSAAALVLPLVFKGETIGALELHGAPDRPFDEEHARQLQPFADAAAVAIENARLYEQARLSATLAERNRLARELHDTIAQGLTAVTMQLEAAQRSFDRDSARARSRLGRAHELARETLADVRRSVWILAEPLVDGGALPEALDALTQRFAERTGLPASYRHQGGQPALQHSAATQALRVVQEALQNAEKHAQATHVEVASRLGDTALHLEVRDDGVGFEPSAPQPGDGGFGLLSLRERARLAGGELLVESAPGAGTRISLVIPLGRGLRTED
jgi:signal transduction histidine kinase